MLPKILFDQNLFHFYSEGKPTNGKKLINNNGKRVIESGQLLSVTDRNKFKQEKRELYMRLESHATTSNNYYRLVSGALNRTVEKQILV